VDLDSVGAWTASGVMTLTGRADGPPLEPPASLVPRLVRLAARLPFALDPLELLGERAAISGFARDGDVSCGGATHLMRTADGWIAVTLARDDDVDMVPAWLELDAPSRDHWAEIEAAVRTRTSADVVSRARLLGMPVAALGEVAPVIDPVVNTTFEGTSTRAPANPPLVVDLSSLWAGPLCSRLLHMSGARVIKVESRDRPDGARRGPPAFFDLLNAGKENVTLDFSSLADLNLLRGLLMEADVVIESSRPRAFEQLGIFAADVLAAGPTVWVSINGYGRAAPGRDWVAFGDDAAVAGGLVAWDERGPCFCADAIADPLTGLTAAVVTLDALAGGEAVLLDVAMARVAASFA
jgi:hypothetical protein